jgi:hypothetical protein
MKRKDLLHTLSAAEEIQVGLFQQHKHTLLQGHSNSCVAAFCCISDRIQTERKCWC